MKQSVLSNMFVILLVSVGAGYLILLAADTFTFPIPELEGVTRPKEQTATLVFAGDLMLDRGVKERVYENFNGSYEALFANVTTLLQSADIAFLNLEGPISDTGTNVGSKYSFRMEERVLETLRTIGIDIVSFANNHVGDYSLVAFTDTLQNLSDAGIAYAGAGYTRDEAATVTSIKTDSGITIGYLAFSDVGPNWIEATSETPGILLASDPERLGIIAKASEHVDVLIVSYHFGDEYVAVTDRQQSLARSSIDAGADIIIGHHPHVAQSIEEYGDGIIAYSLGNFMFDQYFSKETLRGMLLEVVIKKRGDTLSFTQYTPYTTVQDPYTYRIAYLLRDGIPVQTYDRGSCPVGTDHTPLAPVSRTVSLSTTYTPDSLVTLTSRMRTLRREICVTAETAEHLDDLLYAAHEAGHLLGVTSGYRDYKTQKQLHEEHIREQREQVAETGILGVAEPGHSEHHLGTAVDITAADIQFTPVSQRLGDTAAGQWLQEHAHQYGFVLSYPDGSQQQTGYKYEPWHFRYVGTEIAKQVHEGNVLLHEHLSSN